MNEKPEEIALQPGLSTEVEQIVGKAETAVHMGSGSLAVYATPALVALMENAAVRALEGYLPHGHTTVGGQIDVRHLEATPVGMKVHAHAELIEVQGRKITFRIQAWDEVELIGEANHIRFLIEEETFMDKVMSKGSKSQTE
ncbi:MAG: thioesterase family protein [Anaerolineales bacterium]|jgi:predicted thioesterase